MNPFVTWSENGTQYTCPFCKLLNDLPVHYHSPVIGGQRSDIASRPELYRGSVEYVATDKYYSRPPTPPIYVFLLDTSASAIQSGLVYSFATSLQRLLPSLFSDSPIELCFLTYSNSINFFNISTPRPQMAVLPDLDKTFLPLPRKAFMRSYRDAKACIDRLLLLLPEMYSKALTSSNAMGSSLEIVFKVLSSEKLYGKIFLFTSGLVDLGHGKLDKRIANAESDTEKTLYEPQTHFYKKLAENFARAGVSVDLFCCSSTYSDLATLGDMVKFTGGQCYYYPSFFVHSHGEQLYRELFRSFTRDSGYDGMMRIRTSTGISPSGDTGHFFLNNDTDLMVATITADSAVHVEFVHDENLKDNDVVCIQAALLYTNKEGNRRIRVHNYKTIANSSLPRVWKAVDLDSTLNILIRSSLSDIGSNKMSEVRLKFFSKLFAILAAYKNTTKTGNSAPLVLPEALRLLPLYVLALLKTPLMAPLRHGTYYPVLADARSYLMMLHNSMNLRDQAPLLYPILYEVHTMAGHPKFGLSGEIPGLVFFPGMIRLSVDSLSADGIYLMDTVERLYLWVGASAHPELVGQLLLPEECTPDMMKTMVILTRKETDLSYRLFNLLSSRQFQRRFSPEVFVIHQGSPLEPFVQMFLVEDGLPNSRDVKDMNYGDFLREIIKNIANR
eukprot:TRINITY_DN9463_c0_g2_i2.p1 TRINITY_DN9463_c0_g2~~TRINITY_DN9463_c0_g2_i2.p1  ORF type:complete len:670 (-),score=83.43 TRINITY_DN9463_c0_g2_i2:191-2200(-)